MNIRKGAIYWVNSTGRPRQPVLVIQNDALNESRLSTVTTVALTGEMAFGELPGNVILRQGDANLPRACVVNVSRIDTVDKAALGEMIGQLDEMRLKQVQDGLRLVLDLS